MNMDTILKFNFEKKRRLKKICSIENCNNRTNGTYCSKHYHQLKRYGKIKDRTRFDKNEIIIDKDIAKILLYDNDSNIINTTIIDASDIYKINKYKIFKQGNYAYANINNKPIALHRIITDTVNVFYKRDKPIDHINGDTLDNRKENLRIVTCSQNSFNSIRQRNKTAGVRKHIQKNKYVSYQVYISVNKKQINLGYFKTKEQAKLARAIAEVKYNIFNS